MERTEHVPALQSIMSWLNGLMSVLLAAAITRGTYGQSGLTEEQKQQFVDAHNSLRGNVDPTATNMETMVLIQSGMNVNACLHVLYSCVADMER